VSEPFDSPLPPPQAVNPSERAAATAAYFTTERRFITTPKIMAGADPAARTRIFASAPEVIIGK
jgi:hypothetical protein